ncbi:MAG: 50S ribosomal protein L33 [Wolbachia sp.]
MKTTKTGEEKSTGYFYVKKRNPKKLTKKLEFRKYDPVVRRHVLFKEEKLK